jgi:hypothetical protein
MQASISAHADRIDTIDAAVAFFFPLAREGEGAEG